MVTKVETDNATMRYHDWRDDAACANYDPELWFADQGAADAYTEARAICNSCPVRETCLEWSLTHYVEYGMWGGLSAIQRKKMRSERGMRKPREWGDLVPCGTATAVRRHQRLGEPLDEQCREAKNELSRLRRLNRTRKIEDILAL